MTSSHVRLHLPLVLVLGLVLAACQSKQGPALPAKSGQGAPPPTTIPSLGELSKGSPAPVRGNGAPSAGTGTLRPLHSAALGPKETGLITSILVDEGDAVKKGAVLFRLDSVQAGLAVDQAQAAVATVQVQVDAAKLDHDRTQALRERGSVSPEAVDQVASRLDAANSALRQAKTALSMSERHSANMVVTAPFDGVITERRMNVGETATLMPPSVVVVLQDLDALELRARLPESALRHVHEGSELDVRFPSIDQSRSVRVKRIAPTIDALTRTIEIIADVDNRDRRLLVGMLAEVAYADAASAPGAAAQAAPSAPRAEREPPKVPQ